MDGLGGSAVRRGAAAAAATATGALATRKRECLVIVAARQRVLAFFIAFPWSVATRGSFPWSVATRGSIESFLEASASDTHTPPWCGSSSSSSTTPTPTTTTCVTPTHSHMHAALLLPPPPSAWSCRIRMHSGIASIHPSHHLPAGHPPHSVSGQHPTPPGSPRFQKQPERHSSMIQRGDTPAPCLETKSNGAHASPHVLMPPSKADGPGRAQPRTCASFGPCAATPPDRANKTQSCNSDTSMENNSRACNSTMQTLAKPPGCLTACMRPIIIA